MKGFTLIEVILVIAIITLISVVGLAKYINFQKSSQINAFAEEFAATLKSAKNKSINAEIPANMKLTDFDANHLPFWVVEISSGSYSLYAKYYLNGGTGYSQSNPAVTAFDPTFYSITPAATIAFDRLTGTSSSASFTLAIASSSSTDTVTVSSRGDITIIKN